MINVYETVTDLYITREKWLVQFRLTFEPFVNYIFAIVRRRKNTEHFYMARTLSKTVVVMTQR